MESGYMTYAFTWRCFCTPAMFIPELLYISEVNIFHNFAIKLMMGWSQMEISNRDLIKELYSLLYRQHNRASEVSVTVLCLRPIF